ncbi:MAG: hypothetical protein WAQ27_01865 [Candidatus Microsaccharimonas sp.]
MATFLFNKLIRDGLEATYVELNQQATYRKLSNKEYIQALKDKLIEEAKEINPEDRESVINELADVCQVIEDLSNAYNISSVEINTVKDAKFKKKGGFSKALFVEKLKLTDDDEWNDYYRKEPEIFKELPNE